MDFKRINHDLYSAVLFLSEWYLLTQEALWILGDCSSYIMAVDIALFSYKKYLILM